MKLHLGCGGNYLPGYLNIDYPQNKHTVLKVKADRYADILNLKFPQDSIEEIRLHHVFEHFKRTEAWALLGIWNSWLIQNGLLRIEVPDFSKNAQKASKNPLLLRHLFGSQEAPWASHNHGWTEAEFKKLLKIFGYKLISTRTIKYKGMFNLEIIAKKTSEVEKNKLISKTSDYMTIFLVDNSPSELALKSVWLKEFTKLLK